MSPSTLPADRPRWAVATVRAIQAVLAVLALAVLAWMAVARPMPDHGRAPSGPAQVTVTTLAPPAYTPTPAGRPRTAAEPQGASR